MLLYVLQCVPLSGRGFTRGSYVCACQRGFYFPERGVDNNSFNGSDVERFTFNESDGVTSGQFRCLPCSAGCDDCVDGRLCQYANNLLLRSLLLVLTTVVVIAILASSMMVTVFRSAKVGVGRSEHNYLKNTTSFVH